MANVDSCTSIAENRQKYAKYFDEKASGTGQYNVDMFYKLLLAEMSNQDPLEPTSNTEFVSQMASFTSLQNQQDTLHYSTNNYASSLVGKTVIVASSSGTNIKTETGVVTSLNLSGETAEITVNGQKYKLSNVMEIVSDGNATASQSPSAGAFATSLIGKKVSVTATNSAGEVIAEQGIVSAVQSQDGIFSIVIDDIAYPITSVVKVENEIPVEQTETKPTEESDPADEDNSGETTTSTDTNVTTNGGTTTTTTTTVTRDADGKIIDTDTIVSTQKSPDYVDTDEEDIPDIEDSTTDDSELQELFS